MKPRLLLNIQLKFARGAEEDELLPKNVEQIDDVTEIEETGFEEPRCVRPNRKRKNATEIIGNALLNMEQQKLNYLKTKQIEKKMPGDEDRNFFESFLLYAKRIIADTKLIFRDKFNKLCKDSPTVILLHLEDMQI